MSHRDGQLSMGRQVDLQAMQGQCHKSVIERQGVLDSIYFKT
jgi:hypothetical protein